MIGQQYYDKLRNEAFARNSFNNGFVPNTTRRVKHTKTKPAKMPKEAAKKTKVLNCGYMVFKNAEGYITRVYFERGTDTTKFDRLPLPVTPEQYIVYAKSVRGLDFVKYENGIGALAR